MKIKSIMFTGTGSGVGKSVITAAFCRIFKNRGLRAAPFKAQNMALNSFVTNEGAEIGRAQAFQAEAAKIQPDYRMNPILLKPSGDNCSQVILNGKPVGNYNAEMFYKNFKLHRSIARKAYDSLTEDFDIIVMEGAGSPAEINLMKRDIVNMPMAEYAKANVYLIGDIDKGGVFASFKGTFDLLKPKHQKLLKGFIINKFRGDINLLTPAFKLLKKHTPIPVLGVIPYNHSLRVDEEDAVYTPAFGDKNKKEIHIGIIRLPAMSNFTDFEPLQCESDVYTHYIHTPQEMIDCDCVIIPGSKTTINDFEYLKKTGFNKILHSFAAEKKIIFGMCGGFQMLGKYVIDKNNIESNKTKIRTFGFFDFETIMTREKILKQIDEQIIIEKNIFKIKGYEIHNGESRVDERIIIKKNIFGTYIHGIFDNNEYRRWFINKIRELKKLPPIIKITDWQKIKDKNIDKLAELVDGVIRLII